MNDLKASNGATEITAQDQVLNAHQFLLDFLAKFDHAKRGGIHDFVEITLFNMINASIKNIDDYLTTGHKEVNPNEIMAIIVDSYQKSLDKIKRNLETLQHVSFI